MYACSNDFHTAVANGAPQKALLIFSDCVFTDSDISVENGIRFSDYFNRETDLAIGQTPSNEISFSLFNDDRLLNSYEFGEFLATLGVLIETATYTKSGNCKLVTPNATYVGNSSTPYLTRDGSAVSSSPGFAVKSLLCYDGKLYAFSGTGNYAVYNDSTGAKLNNVTLNNFMKNKSKGWNGNGMYYNPSNRILKITNNGVRKRYEFCPLGKFIAERPKAPDVIQIDLNCYDFMQKFDVDMPADSALGVTYPISIQNLFIKMCQYLNVSYTLPDPFINGSAMIQRRPDEFDTATMREVLHWIAEASCTNARFNRDGVLELVWLRTTGQTYAATGYGKFNPYWYETKTITKLHNRDTQGSAEKTYGNGDEGYLIQDNPLLKGVN